MWYQKLWMAGPQWLPWGVVVAASLVAAIIDVRRHRIPNWLTGPVLAGGLFWAWYSQGLAGVADAACGCIMLAFPYVVLFVSRSAAGGAGDAKLMGAIGAWLGVYAGAAALVSVSLCGVVIGIVYALAKKRMKKLANNVIAVGWRLVFGGPGLRVSGPEVNDTSDSVGPMPYGLAIFSGTFLACIGVQLWRT